MKQIILTEEMKENIRELMKLRIKITDKGNKTNLHLDPLF
jgi:hypothetical protein